MVFTQMMRSRGTSAKQRASLTRGDGVLTGGATGVDYFAMDEVSFSQPHHISVSSFPHALKVYR